MKRPFELLEHTADVRLRAWGESLPRLYENAARGLLWLIVAPESVRPTQEQVVEVCGTDAVDLLVRWLNELLYDFDARRRLCAEVRVEEFAEWRLRAVLKGEPLDLSRHELHDEIKAVTYHQAKVQKCDEGWVAEVILDV